MKKFNKNKIIDNIKVVIFRDFRIKVTCFLLAIAMFLAISILQRHTKTYPSKLKIVGLRDYFVISNNIPDTVKIIAKDNPDVFDKITEEDFNVRLDLSQIDNTDIYQVKLKWDIPENMKSFFSTVRIEPKIIRVDIDSLAERNVDIIINTIGNPLSGYIVKRTSIDPPSIRIQGPQGIVYGLDSIKTETINIEGVKESFSRQVDLSTPYKSVKVLGKADLYFEIIPESDLVSFEFEQVFFQNLKEQFKASTKEKINVTLRGPKNVIGNIKEEDVSIIIDCANIAFPGEYVQDIKVKRPKNFEIVSIKPQKVKILVKDK